MSKNYSVTDLQYLMSRLRDPETGCPWDIKQTYKSITAYTVEEVYEVVDAIDRNDLTHLSEELGDLLFQIIFYCQLAEEQGAFDFDQVVSKITCKLVIFFRTQFTGFFQFQCMCFMIQHLHTL